MALDNETTSKLSRYVGLTYDITPDAVVYTWYSDVFQAHDQRGVDGQILSPMKGVNGEVGVKAEWLGRHGPARKPTLATDWPLADRRRPRAAAS